MDFQGRVQFATVDVGDPAGRELGQRYGSGPQEMAVVYFDRNGNVAQREPTITDEQAKQVLDRLLGVR